MDSRTAEITEEQRRAAPVIGPRLRLLLRVVLVSFGLLSLNTADCTKRTGPTRTPATVLLLPHAGTIQPRITRLRQS